MSAQGTTAQSETPRESFATTFSNAMLRRVMVGVAASAATAATAYLTRKGRELWDEKAAPMIEEKGGLEVVAHDAYTKASEWLEATTGKVAESGPVSAVAEKVEEVRNDSSGSEEPEIQPGEIVSDPEREAEREERRKRREARQRQQKRSKAA
jgi:hypothetical protein